MYIYGVSLVFLVIVHVGLCTQKRKSSDSEDERSYSLEMESREHSSAATAISPKKDSDSVDKPNPMDSPSPPRSPSSLDEDEKSALTTDELDTGAKVPTYATSAEGINFFLRLGAIGTNNFPLH